MRTHNIPSCYRKSEILIMHPALALLSTLIGSNYPCLELIFMVPKVFEPLKFDCILITIIEFNPRNMICNSQEMPAMLNKTCHRDRIACLTVPCPSHKKFLT